MKKPKLVLLDEATAGKSCCCSWCLVITHAALDSKSEEQIQLALEKYRATNKNITLVIIAHRLSTVHNADLIAVVKGGAVVESGNHEVSFAAPAYLCLISFIRS